jgi:rSAM/selenodomain-associated transferase 2
VISIIIPTLNEEATIVRTLTLLQALDGNKDIVVVDGGSEDGTVEQARTCGVPVIEAGRGRGTQMHAGAIASRGDVLWFVHADTVPNVNALSEMERALADPRTAGGNFSVVFSGASRAARQLTAIYPSLRWLGLSYGDAGIFVRRSVYHRAGGFRSYALFEDLDLIRRIKREGRFVHLECAITTSSRRFEERNFALIWIHWIALQLLYWIGVSPNRLAQWYRHVR